MVGVVISEALGLMCSFLLMLLKLEVIRNGVSKLMLHAEYLMEVTVWFILKLTLKGF